MSKNKRIIGLIMAFISFVACAQENNRILVFAKTKGFFHTSIPKGMETIMKICITEGIQVDTTRDAAAFTAVVQATQG